MNALLHVIKNRQEANNKSAAGNAEVHAVAQDAQQQQPVGQVTPTAAPDAEENCPVIRANQVFLSAANSGRLRVVFF